MTAQCEPPALEVARGPPEFWGPSLSWKGRSLKKKGSTIKKSKRRRNALEEVANKEPKPSWEPPKPGTEPEPESKPGTEPKPEPKQGTEPEPEQGLDPTALALALAIRSPPNRPGITDRYRDQEYPE